MSYDNAVKESVLNVNIGPEGVVSEGVVKQMALNTQKILNSDYSIAVSGVAGPSGGTSEKPVGTVWVAIAGPGSLETLALKLHGSRETIIQSTVNNVLGKLWQLVVQ